METLMLNVISDSIQRDRHRYAMERLVVREYGSKRCPTPLDTLLARVGAALSHTGARLEHRSDCGCPDSPAPVS